jgi:predicted transcriptional regulator
MEKEKLTKLIELGFSANKIAKELECSQTNIRYWLKKFNLKTHATRGIQKTRQESVDWNLIQKEYDSGLTYKGLCKKFKLNTALISGAKRAGLLKTRNTKDAAKLFVKNLNDKERKEHFGKSKGNSSGKMGGYRKNAGRSKKYKVKDSFGNDTHLQSSYEKLTADLLDELNIKWIRPKYLKYGNKKYFPDFYLVGKDVYLDPKNDYLAKLDKTKIDKVCKENNVVVLILTKEKITKEFLQSLL